MNSSIFKIVFTLLLTIALSSLVYKIRPTKDYSKLLYDSFWASKTFPSNKYSTLVIGDSRVYRGISPQKMEDVLGNQTVINLGYSSGSMSKQMFDFSMNQLNLNAQEKIVVLGISPFSLTKEARKNEHLNQELNRTKISVLERKHIYPYLSFFEPFKLTDFKKSQNNRYYQYFNKQGWVASTRVPSNPQMALTPYKEQLQLTSISDKSIEETYHFVKYCTSNNIRVFGFRPPTTPEMENIENVYTKFDFDLFIKNFEKQGGVWIELPKNNDYHSYDGSHLDYKSAERLSTYIAQKIKNTE